jgi:hypothetical protein
VVGLLVQLWVCHWHPGPTLKYAAESEDVPAPCGLDPRRTWNSSCKGRHMVVRLLVIPKNKCV